MDVRKMLWIFTLIAKVLIRLLDEITDIFDGNGPEDPSVESQPVGPFDVLNPDQKRDIAKVRDECCK